MPRNLGISKGAITKNLAEQMRSGVGKRAAVSNTLSAVRQAALKGKVGRKNGSVASSKGQQRDTAGAMRRIVVEIT